MPGTVLIIDDEEQLRKLLARIISLEGFKVIEAASLKTAMDQLNHQPVDIILCDVRLPDGNGVEFVRNVRTRYSSSEIILLTAYGNIADGVQAMKNGAFDYIVKGNDNDRIIPLLHQALGKVTNNKKAAVKIKQESSVVFDDILGNSATIKDATRIAEKIAPTDTTVLLTGETGTGKEVFANAIHSASKRAKNAFVAINCSAFPSELLESELFGHKAGAYTGATKDKKGLIELADKGTLFLDEIGEMKMDLQAKILRVIETGEFIKVGDEKKSKADIRLITATNRDLNKEIAEGNFRQDLYYRLNVFSIQLPPLRDRPEDIPLLAEHFRQIFTTRENKQGLPISREAMTLLQQYAWRGNIRQLRNVIERAVILCDRDRILPEDLPYEIQKRQGSQAHSLSLMSVEKKHIEKVLSHTKGNKTRAADLLGIGLTTLYRKLEEYHIEK